MGKKRLTVLTVKVSPQTAYHLRELAAVCGYKSVGQVVDKLVREKQISLKEWGWKI